MATQVAVPISSIPGSWLIDATGSLIARHPDVPRELPALVSCPYDGCIEASGRVWRVRVEPLGDGAVGAALPIA